MMKKRQTMDKTRHEQGNSADRSDSIGVVVSREAMQDRARANVDDGTRGLGMIL